MLENSYADLLYLVSCEVNQIRPDIGRVKQMDLAMVHEKAKKHLLVSISYMGLEASGVISDAEWKGSLSEETLTDLKKWKQEKEKGVRKNLLLDVERQKLTGYLEKEHIWYMPLKGSILKDLYPSDGMRQMADNDILFDASAQERVHEYFVQEGYEVVSYKKGNHDVYEKKPIYNFEMHTSLFGYVHDDVWRDYYQNVKERLIKDEGREYGHHFSDEDFYVYFVVHACKHHEGCGTGIRTLLDCYVYQKNRTLDWSYIEGEAEKLDMAEFEKVLRSASRKLFSPDGGFDSLTEEEAALVEDHAVSGIYGNIKAGYSKKLQKIQKDGKTITTMTKLKYYLRRVFPEKDYYLSFHPTIYKLKFPIPFFIVYRIFKGLIVHRKKLSSEARIVWKMDK